MRGFDGLASTPRLAFAALTCVAVACSGEIEGKQGRDVAAFGDPAFGPPGTAPAAPGAPGTGGGPGAAPQSPGAGELVGEVGDPRIPQRIWRLTPAQLDDEVRRLFGEAAPTFDIPESASEAGITNIAANGVVDLGNAARFADGARAIGAWVAAQGAAATRCTQYGSDLCVDTFMGWLLRGAFRRPVSAEETQELRALFEELRAGYDYDYAIAGLVRAVLLSPDFLYRTELGAGAGLMAPYEIANLLAFAITDRSPDGPLFDAAERGELADAGNRELHARRLMGQSDRTWQRLFWEWLSLSTLYSQGAEVGLDEELVAQMEEEYRAFVSDVVVTGRGGLRQLLSASYTFARPALAAHYGAVHPGGELARVELDPLQRGGLLTQGAWLVSHGKAGKDNVVRRGMNIFKQAMCNNNLAPPEGLDVDAELEALVGADATVRETVDARAAAPTCGACHRLADPIGMVFESYTSDGRWQASYPDGLPVDTRVTLQDVGEFDNAPAMSAALVDDAAFQQCFVRRVVHYLAGIDMGSPTMAAWVQQAHAAFVQHDTSLEELLVAIVRHPAFVERPMEVSP